MISFGNKRGRAFIHTHMAGAPLHRRTCPHTFQHICDIWLGQHSIQLHTDKLLLPCTHTQTVTHDVGGCSNESLSETVFPEYICLPICGEAAPPAEFGNKVCKTVYLSARRDPDFTSLTACPSYLKDSYVQRRVLENQHHTRKVFI